MVFASVSRLRGWMLASVFASLGGEALAQTATNVATQVIDAFGEKVGSEQIGLYSEQQVRGFSLQDSGNYRLDGAYFIRAANIVDPSFDGVTIRVGINALGVDFPAPSGIVEYRLRTTEPGAHEDLELAYREYGGNATFLRGSISSADNRIGTAYGVSILNDTGSDGMKRRPRHYALVPTWRPTDALQIKGLMSFDRFKRPGGDYGTVATGDALPPVQPNPGTYNVAWGKVDQLQSAGGVVARYVPSENVALRTSFVLTDIVRDRGDFTQLALGPDGTGTATTALTRPLHQRGMAGEAYASWRLSPRHRVFSTLRWRRGMADVKAAVQVPLGFVDQRMGVSVTPTPADPPDVDPQMDRTREIIAGMGYEADWTEKLWMRAGVLRSAHRRQVTPPGGPLRRNSTSPWLYDFAARYEPLANLTVFATTVKGLEESGTAPSNAANRNEVLPAVHAKQYELGLRYRHADSLTFIGSVFQITKPTPGLDANNVYGLVGEARHRGVELSLTGRPMDNLNVVGGLALLEAARRGVLVDQGVIRDRAAGIPAVTALLNVTYSAPFINGLSIDSQFNYTSQRLASTRRGLYSPAFATLDIGVRYNFAVKGNTAVIRAQLRNVFDEDAWIANRNETLGRQQRRGFRISLTTSFDHEL